jgi:VWFA-related protein
MIRRALALSLVLSSVVGRAGSQQNRPSEQPPTFPAGVEQVTVDVVVVDRKRQPVTDLTKEELEVYEDGVQQAIVSFDAFQVSPAAGMESAAPVPRISTNAAAKDEGRGRTFVIVFDDVHLTAYTALRARQAVVEFLTKETREGDRVTLVGAGSGNFWATRMPAGRDELIDLVKRLEGRLVPETPRDRMSDYEAMRIHVYRDSAIMNRVQRRYETYAVPTATEQGKHVLKFRAQEDPYVTAKATEVYYAATARNRLTLAAVERSLLALADVRGRKSLILVSDGFIYDAGLDLFKRIIGASRRSNTAIYFVNGRGLEGLPLTMDADLSTTLPAEDIGFAFAEAAETTEGSESLAADSGGFAVRNSNDLASGLKRIADETRAYYLVGYTPKNTARDGVFRKIQVKVKGRKGVEVRARKGYYASSDAEVAPTSKAAAAQVFQRAIDSPYEREDIPLRMTHFVREETRLDKALVYLVTEVDIRGLGLAAGESQPMGALQILLVTMQRENGELFRYDQRIELNLPPETRALVARNWLPIVREFELGPGHHRAKIVVQDKATERVGTVVHDFEVPSPAGFRVSTPVLSDLRGTAPEGETGDRLAILARRDFAQQGTLFCQLEVYGATREEASGLPRVSMGYEVRASDGSLYSRDAPSRIIPTPRGGLSRLIGFSLEGATAGDYELLMRLKDEFSGKTLELREPFHVSSAPPGGSDLP